MNKTYTNSEFIKRMIVDSENLATIRKKFFNGEKITEEEINKVISTTPTHKDGNWGKDSISMIPWSGLQQLDKCIRDVVKKNIPGDFVETGVWRGGSCIITKAIFNELRVNKKIFVADSFEGLPKPNIEKYPDDINDTHYLNDTLKVSLEDVKRNFERFNCLDNNVIFLKGWFKDTLPTAPIDKISILRLDGDMYESTIDVLENLYHKLSIGGYCIIDDYGGHPACKEAVEDFRRVNKIKEPIIKVDDSTEVHYWIKEKVTTFAKRDYPKRGITRLISVSKKKLLTSKDRSIKKAKNIVKRMLRVK